MRTLLAARHKPDYLIITCVALLVVFGLIMLISASAHLGKLKFGDSYYFLTHQILYGLIPGLIGFLLACKVYYGVYEKFAWIILLVAVVLLLLIFSPLGIKAGGAERWLQVGGATFQPSEFLKLALIIYLAAWLSGNPERQRSFWRGFLSLMIILGAIGTILLSQSSTSVFVLMLASSAIIYFISGAKLSHLFSLAVVGATVLLLVIIYTPYRLNRVLTYLNPAVNQQSAGYHVNQALIAIGSGGLTGVGFGQSTTKISYLPEPIGDSIFAVIAEEMGFIGAMTIIILYATLVLRLFWLSRRLDHKFGQLLLIGFGSLIGLQAFTNMAAISGLIPLTGTPLPFISYGGSGLTIFLIAAGITINVSTYTRES